MSTILLFSYFFIIGTLFGSFLNMLVYRVNAGQSLLGRSYCDKSKKTLQPVDLIPIVSYIIYRGRCRDCGAKLPIMYPLVELLTGVLSGCVYLLIAPLADPFNLFSNIAYWSLGFSLVFVFLFFAYYDFLYWEVDLRSLYFAGAFLVILNIINALLFYFAGPTHTLPFFTDPLQHLLGGIVLASIIGIVFKLSNGGGMGEGDIYLFGLSGLALGLPAGFMAFVFTCIYGSILGLIKAARTGKLHGTKIQLAPFIALGTITMLFFKDLIMNFFFARVF